MATKQKLPAWLHRHGDGDAYRAGDHRFYTVIPKDETDERLYEWCEHCGRLLEMRS